MRMIDEAAPVAQVHQQLQDLGLDRHVERRRRLVGDEDPRVAGQRHRDHRPLAHAAGELVRIAAVGSRRIGQADLRAAISTAAARAARGAEPSWKRMPSATWSPIRITGSRWLVGSWKIMPMAPPRTSRICGSVACIRSRPSSSTAPAVMCSAGDGQQAHQRPAEQALARAALADEAEDLAAAEVEGHAVDQPARPRAVLQLDREVADREQRRASFVHAQDVGRGRRRGG